MFFWFGINKNVLDKTPLYGFEGLQKNWETYLGTVENLADFVRNGFAFMPGLLDGDRRLKANVKAAQSLAIDVDEGSSISEALSHPFVKQYCALGYTSFNHQKEKTKQINLKIPPGDRFRLIFVLPNPLSDLQIYENLIDWVAEMLPHDPTCREASRFFFGNTNAEIFLCDRTKILPEESFWLASQKNQAKPKFREFPKPVIARLDNSIELDKLIEEALSFIPARQPGTGNYHQCLKVAMALHSHYGNNAIEIIEQWSPTIPGTTWNVPKKVKSFRRSGIRLGTLFWIAKNYGFEFQKNHAQT